MCGIFGWDLRRSGVGSKQRLVLGTVLGLLNDTRGGDSWGFLHPLSLTVEKGMDNIVPFAYKLARYEIIGAHTRKATTGAKTVANAHPFEFGDIIGAHNGMVYNHDHLKRENKVNHEVDSMHIFDALSKDKDLSEMDGYGAIWWINKGEQDKFHICKLSPGADLCIFGVGRYEEPSKGVIWSSSEGHLDKAVEAAGIEGFKYKIETHKVYTIEGGRLMTTDMELKFNSNARGSWVSQYSTGYTGYASHWSRPEKGPGILMNGETPKSISFGDMKISNGKLSVFDSWVRGVKRNEFLDPKEFIETNPSAKASEYVEEIMLYLDRNFLDIEGKGDIYITYRYYDDLLDRLFEAGLLRKGASLDAMDAVDELEKSKNGEVKFKGTTVIDLSYERKERLSKEQQDNFPTQEDWDKMTDDEQLKLLEELNVQDAINTIKSQIREHE